MKVPIEIVVAEDSEDDFVFFERTLRMAESNGYLGSCQVNVQHVTTFAGLVSKLKEGKFDLVIYDINLPDTHEVRALESIAEEYPVIVLSGTEDPKAIENVARCGAVAMILKKHLSPMTLGQAARFAFGKKLQMSEDLKFRRASPEEQANHERVIELCQILAQGRRGE